VSALMAHGKHPKQGNHIGLPLLFSNPLIIILAN